MNNIKLLKIPFVSKKKYYEILEIKNSAKYKFEGIAYYLINENFEIIWQRAKITNTFEYRPTDEKMLVTDFYKNLMKRKINREDIFPFSNKGIETSNKDQLEELNKIIFKNLKTILSVEGFISGSNSSGADKKPNTSPILFNPQNSNNNNDYIRFVNAFKRITRKTNETKIIEKMVENDEINNFDQLEEQFYEISLTELLDNNEKLKLWMNIINSNNLENKNKKLKDEIEEEYIRNIKEKDIDNNIKEIFTLYKKNLITQEKLITKLRNDFRKKLIQDSINKNINEFLESEINIFDSEAAHIFDVKDIRNELNNNPNEEIVLRKIVDIDNGLLLEPTIHKLFDKHKITFNEEGNLIPQDKHYRYLKEKKINDKALTNKRKKYISDRNKLHNLVVN